MAETKILTTISVIHVTLGHVALHITVSIIQHVGIAAHGTHCPGKGSGSHQPQQPINSTHNSPFRRSCSWASCIRHDRYRLPGDLAYTEEHTLAAAKEQQVNINLRKGCEEEIRRESEREIKY